jgi:hypothetical protein
MVFKRIIFFDEVVEILYIFIYFLLYIDELTYLIADNFEAIFRIEWFKVGKDFN